MVGRVCPSARTTAMAIKFTAKGETGREETIETTIGVGDDTGSSSKQRPADKLLLIERVGLALCRVKTKTSEQGNDKSKQYNSGQGNHVR